VADATRLHFQDELQALERQALAGLDMVVESLDRALEMVRHPDVELANKVISDDDRIDGRYLEMHGGLLTLLARQAPVASDLRLVSALLQVIYHMERMGDQCVNVAKLVPLAGHDPPAHPGMLDRLAQMGQRARSQVVQCKRAFERRDVALAHDLVRQDDEIDRLNRECFQLGLEIGDDAHRREWAMHMMLVARCIERIGDNAVDVGEQTAFVVTGLFREFEDASHPSSVAGGSASGASSSKRGSQAE
jgi:phosphate transport system protein